MARAAAFVKSVAGYSTIGAVRFVVDHQLVTPLLGQVQLLASTALSHWPARQWLRIGVMSSGRINADELHLAAFALEVGDLFWLLRSRSAVVGQVRRAIRSALAA
jgi:hypothetical protein